MSPLSKDETGRGLALLDLAILVILDHLSLPSDDRLSRRETSYGSCTHSTVILEKLNFDSSSWNY